jgi:hypothetical protein
VLSPRKLISNILLVKTPTKASSCAGLTVGCLRFANLRPSTASAGVITAEIDFKYFVGENTNKGNSLRWFNGLKFEVS